MNRAHGLTRRRHIDPYSIERGAEIGRFDPQGGNS
jgi:hypothetical protein